MRYLRNTLVWIAAASLWACGDVAGPADEGAASGTLVGRVEQAAPSTSVSLSISSTSSSQGLSVAAARVRSDGGLQALAEAAVAADGSFRIEDVPAGERPLVVVATTEQDAEIGRVIVQGAVPAGGSVTVEPLDGKTTVAAHVLSELASMGIAPEAINTAELALAIDVRGEGAADEVIGSAQSLRALAQGVSDFQEIHTAILAELGIDLDAEARLQAALPAVLEHARQRHEGVGEEVAAAARNQAIVEAYAEAGAEHRNQVVALSGAGTGLLRASEVASAEARLDIARAALEIHMLARERLIADALASLGLPAADEVAVQEALQRAQDAIDGAGTLAELEAGVADALAEAEAALETALERELPTQAQQAMQTALVDLPDQVDLESRLETAADASAVAEVYVSFFAELRQAVFNAVAELAANGGDIDGPAVADAFTALRGLIEVP